MPYLAMCQIDVSYCRLRVSGFNAALVWSAMLTLEPQVDPGGMHCFVVIRYAIEKAGHCKTLSLGGRNTTQVVLEFFPKVEKALAKDTGGLTPLQGSLIGVGAMAAAVLTSYVVTLYKKNVAADADANQLQDGGHADVKVMAHVATGDGIDVPYQRVENE